MGCALPPLFAPGGMSAFRFVSRLGGENNHKPVCIQNPARRLPNAQRTSGYALSCFDSEANAVRRYSGLLRSFRNTPKTVGDALCSGVLSNEDGMVTAVARDSGHFDLYESVSCDLSKTFKIVKTLWRG